MRFFAIGLLFVLFTGFSCIDEDKGKGDLHSDGAGNLLSKLELSNVEVELPHYEEDLFVSYYRKRDYARVIDELTGGYKLAKAELDLDLSFSRSYVIGMSFFYEKRYKEAIPYLLMSIKYNSPIQDYIYYNLGLSYYRSEGFKDALYYFSLLRYNYPFFREIIKVIELEARYYLLNGEFLTLRREFLPFLDRINKRDGINSSSVDIARLIEQLCFFLARSYSEGGNYDKAIFYYRKQLNLLSSLSYAKETVKDIQSSSYKDRLNAVDHLFVARYYFKKKDYKRVVSFLDKAGSTLSSLSLSSFPLREKFRYVSMLFVSHERLGNDKKAYNLYNKYFSYFKDSIFHKKLDYVYSRSFKSRDYVKAYHYLRTIVMDSSHPMSKEASKDIMSLLESMLETGLVLSSSNIVSSSDLSSLLTKVLNIGNYRLVERFFLSYLGKGRDYGFIFRVFSGIDYSLLKPYRKPIFFYWLGEISMKLGNRDKGISFFKRSYLVHRRNYYSHLSGDRLASLLGEEDESFKKICMEERENYKEFLSSSSFNERLSSLKTEYDFSKERSYLFHKSFTFLSIGELEIGYVLFKEYVSGLSDRHHYYLLSAKLFEELGLNQFFISYMDLLLDYLNGYMNGGKLIPFLGEKVYPLYYKDIVFDESSNYNIDPYLVMALIREESRFNSSALSVSGALGLMQLLPSTAKWLSTFSNVRYKGVSNLDLYDETVNISLGVRYLDFLFKRSSILKSIAGYNGGPTRIRRLFREIDKANDLVNEDHFIELIDISETRNYAKRVMNSYYMYKLIYSPN